MLCAALSAAGEPVAFDLFAAVRSTVQEWRFLPDWSEFPVPFAVDATTPACGIVSSVPLIASMANVPAARYEIVVAFFIPGSNPMQAANCIHSLTADVDVI